MTPNSRSSLNRQAAYEAGYLRMTRRDTMRALVHKDNVIKDKQAKLHAIADAVRVAEAEDRASLDIGFIRDVLDLKED